jgi:hypothetical protein
MVKEEIVEELINIAIAICFIIGVFYIMYKDLQN